MSTADRHVPFLIVGGGPAGMAAAIEARRHGLAALLLDERPGLGGQVFKRVPATFRVADAALGSDYARGSRVIAEALASGVEILSGAVAWGIWGNVVAVETAAGEALRIAADRILLAPGAYDRPLAFPGWTLPGVITAGAAQTLAKTQRVAPGRRVVVAGSGPLALITAAQLAGLGVGVVAVLEAAPAPRVGAVARLLASGPANWGLLARGLDARRVLARAGVPFHQGMMVRRAEGAGRLERVVAGPVDRDWRPLDGATTAFDADTLCIGYGLFPSVEMMALAGCALRYDEALGGHVPVRDAEMRSSVPYIFTAGDGAGIRGMRIALEDGRIVGLAVARDLGRLAPERFATLAAPIRRRAARYEKFRLALASLYPPGAGAYRMAEPDTTVCRCEEVTLADLEKAGLREGAGAAELKSRTRAAMGLCQGRNCARQIAALVAAERGCALADIPPFTPRAPVRPVGIASIARTMPELPHEDLVL